MQQLISNGHSKSAVLNDYTLSEVKIFYEKSIAKEMNGKADFIESVMIGIGGAFGDKNDYNKSIKPILETLRGD